MQQKEIVSMNLKLEKSLRDDFRRALQVRDRQASVVLRDFMRDYIKETKEMKEASNE